MELVILELTVPRIKHINAKDVIAATGSRVTDAMQIVVLVLVVMLQLDQNVQLMVLTSAEVVIVVELIKMANVFLLLHHPLLHHALHINIIIHHTGGAGTARVVPEDILRVHVLLMDKKNV